MRVLPLLVPLTLTCAALGGACGSGSPTPTSPSDTAATPGTPAEPGDGAPAAAGPAQWSFDGRAWQASGQPPACPTPLRFITPADLSRATSVLYPGQERGGYRPHGGVRFDGPGETGDIQVVAPMNGTLYRGGRYLVGGQVQHLFDIINECGIMHRFDHLRDLAPWLQRIADTFPAPAEGDSRTTMVGAGHAVLAGDTLATSIGFPATGNIFFDWGVYDLRSRNRASDSAGWLALHPGEFAPYAICWFDNLQPADAALVRSLPPGSSESGAASDYC